MGFGTHPHRDMEIITYVLNGELKHQDSMGNGRIIKSGEAQYMAAGTGIRHSEFNSSPTYPVHFLQIWIEPEQRGLTPRYADRSLGEAQKGSLQLIASKSGRDGSFAINQDANLWIGRFAKGDQAIHELLSGRHAWVHVAEGEVLIGGVTLHEGDGAAISEEKTIALLSMKESQVLLFDLN
jgi:hypothetical protein